MEMTGGQPCVFRNVKNNKQKKYLLRAWRVSTLSSGLRRLQQRCCEFLRVAVQMLAAAGFQEDSRCQRCPCVYVDRSPPSGWKPNRQDKQSLVHVHQNPSPLTLFQLVLSRIRVFWAETAHRERHAPETLGDTWRHPRQLLCPPPQSSPPCSLSSVIVSHYPHYRSLGFLWSAVHDHTSPHPSLQPFFSHNHFSLRFPRNPSAGPVIPSHHPLGETV
jgi:hypothetical protein